MNKNAEIPETLMVDPIYHLAASLLHDAIAGFNSGGSFDEAIVIQTRDKDYLNLQFIIRFIERIGDHAKNIAQDTIYTESAVDIRHGGDLPESD